MRYPRRADPVGIGSEEWTDIEKVYSELHDRLPGEVMREFDNKNPNEKGGRLLMQKKIDGSA
ncbi:unnamed protein product [marine sediment metagenome]|uniref:Uncharacterized protein n=1 Tax=marine sediment metagenome TaxID=412755 RepID=X1DMN9_9ZZZZ